MNRSPVPLNRRQTVLALLATALPLAPTRAQTSSALAFPYYSGEQALQGLYSQHLPSLSRAFETQAQALTAAARQHCAAPGSTATLSDAWRRALMAWQALSSPALGPVIERRSQRQIDFWPVREVLVAKALERTPQILADMERVGTPAKGFPAMELLLARKASPAHCPYLVLIAEGIEAEARTLRAGFDTLAARDWTIDEEATRSAFAEWINQWLAGLERLRWAHIGKPLASRRGPRAEFPRLTTEANLADWRAQWQGLNAQARLRPEQHAQPPQPDQALIPIEALLMGKGHLALAQRWAQTLDRVDALMNALPASPPGTRELNPLILSMKAVTTLYQGEVAAALDVPLGFSDADGD